MEKKQCKHCKKRIKPTESQIDIVKLDGRDIGFDHYHLACYVESQKRRKT